MRFVLYGRHDPTTYVIARVVSGIGRCWFSHLELDCDPVLIAFRDGRETARTYDMAGADGWVKGLVLGADGHTEVTL